MDDGGQAGDARGAALSIVRNAVDHDSRVLRAARTLRGLGFSTTILGVVSWTEKRQLTDYEGTRIERIGPSSRLAWAVYRQVSVLSPGREDEPGAGSAERGRRRRPRAPAPARAALRRLLRWATTLAYYRRAIAYVRKLRPDLVHCNDYNTMWIGVAARYLAGSVVIYDSHELWPDRNLRPEPRWWLILCEALFVRVADRVITTSPGYAELMAGRYRIPEPAVVRNIPRSDDPAGAAERALEAARGRPAGWPPVAIYVGGLQPNRGLEPAIRAIALLEGVRLRLLGPGLPGYERRLRDLVRELSLEDRVEFAPAVPAADVVGALAGADVGLALIQPACLSYRLTLPNKLFEYTLAGLPVLASDLPMIARFVREHDVGETVDPDDVAAIATKLGGLVEPGRNLRGREAAVAAARALDGDRELRKLAGVYEEALASRGAARARI